MAQIPFPPGGPQVQAALQNPVRFPDQRLQQYAQGQQPTGQVPPPMAANELTIRNAQRQAASRQSAMQNNPQNSPTIFQQKDAEIAQARAAMQQAQQKEQQLGVIGALMAKKAQDLQAREAMGVAQLPVNPNMFTAMHGGVVFNDGGKVQRFNGLEGPSLVNVPNLLEEQEYKFYGSPRNKAEYNKVDLLRQIELLKPEEKAELLKPGTFGTTPDAYILRRRLQQLGYDVDPKTNRIKQLEMEGRNPITMEQRRALDSFSKGLFSRMTTPSQASVNTVEPETKKKEDTGRKESSKTTTPSGVAGLDIEGRIRRGLASVRGESDEQQRLMSDYQANLDEQYAAINKSNLTDAQKEAARKKVTDAMQAEYTDYTKGRDERMEKIRSALEGKKPDFLSGIISGLPSGAGLPGGPRVADVLAGAAKGLAGQQSEYEKRKQEAILYAARAKEEFAKADMFEKRGQRAEAQAAEDRAQTLADKAATRETQALGIKERSITALLNREDIKQNYERTVAEKAVTAQLDYDSKVALERLKASLQPREVSFYNQILAAFNSGDPKRIQAAKDALTAMGASKLDPNKGNVTESQLRKAYDAAMLKWGTTIDTLNKPKPTYEEWKASSAGKGADTETLDFTGGLK